MSTQPGTGVVYGVTWPTNNLVTINPSTGAATVVAPLTGSVSPSGFQDMGIAFHSDGTLYLTEDDFSPNGLYTVNISTGVATHVGMLSFSTGGSCKVPGIAFSNDDTLYGFCESGYLVSVNTSTGEITKVGQNAGFTAGGAGLAFESSGKLFGVFRGGRTASFDTTTGAATQLGNITSVESLAFAP